MEIVRFEPRVRTAEEAAKPVYKRNPFRAELIYLPFLLFRYHVEMINLFGKHSTEEGLFLTELIGGTPINIKKDLSIKSNVGLSFQDLIHEQTLKKSKDNPIVIERVDIYKENSILPQLLKKDEAVKNGMRLLRYDIMKSIGSFRYRKVDLKPIEPYKVVYYPYWVLYFRDRDESIRFKVVDGITSQVEGEQINQSIQKGMVLLSRKEK